MSEANKAHAAILRQLADVYDAAETELKPMGLRIHVDTKAELQLAIKAIGGKWKKETPNGSADSFVYLHSERLARCLCVDLARYGVRESGDI